MDVQVRKRVIYSNSSAVYGVAFIGAAVYYIQHAVGFWAGVVGVLKACVWPAFLIYHLLDFLKM